MSTLTAKLDPATFEYVRTLVLQQSAIALEASKEYLVETRLMPVATVNGCGSINELVDRLRGKPHGELHRQVVEALATNETSFFRDAGPFEALRETILPPLLAARKERRTLNVWSAACSSGQEPYTLAMLLAERFPQLADWNVQIIATDLSQRMLDRAKAGRYNQVEVNRGLPATLRDKYFQRVGDDWQVKPALAARVRFAKVNLIEPWPVLPTMDVVLLRNVLIYFTVETKRTILSRLRRQMAGDAVLLLGGAESMLGVDDGWQAVSCHGCRFYRPR